MCQFHQIAIVTRYLTRNPRHQASIELKNIALQLTKLNKTDFVQRLTEWEKEWETFMNERMKEEKTGKSRYVHKRLRSAWRSLKTNLDRLFTFESFPDLAIPNTTNPLDGCFSDLKNKLRNHNGLNESRKKRFIDEFLRHKTKK